MSRPLLCGDLAHRKSRGAVLPLVAVSLSAIALMVGLAVDAARAFAIREEVQSAADAAALAGAQELTKDNQGIVKACAEAKAVAQANGFDASEVNIELLPEDVPYKQVRVSIARQFETFIPYGEIKSLHPGGVAIAEVGRDVDPHPCIYTKENLTVSNSGQITQAVEDCTLHIAGNLNVGIGASVTANRIIVKGTVDCQGTCVPDPELKPNYPMDDPLNLNGMPDETHAQASDICVGGSRQQIFWPGLYNGGISEDAVEPIKDGAIDPCAEEILFKTGQYFLQGGGLIIPSWVKSVVSDTDGVYFYNYNDWFIGDPAPFNLGGNVGGELKAMKSGIYANILFMQATELSNTPAVLTGSTTDPFIYGGNMYFPSASVHLAGGNGSQVKTGAIVADEIVFTGGPTLEVDNRFYEATDPSKAEPPSLVDVPMGSAISCSD